MNDRERAIVMAYTGYAMLTGNKLGIFYKYVEEKLGRPIMTHELAFQEVIDEIQEKAKEDFIELCKDEDQEMNNEQEENWTIYYRNHYERTRY